MVVFGIVLFIPLVIKLWDIQITNHEYYENLAVEQQTQSETVEAARGSIYDSAGNTLAVSGTAYTVVLSPKDVAELQQTYSEAVENAEKGEGSYPDYPEPTDEFIAENLSEILDVDKDMIQEKLLLTDRQYEVIATKVDSDVADQVRDLVTDNHLGNAVFLEETMKRYYPYSSLASQLIGFVDSDNVGVYGLEAEYEGLLSGATGQVVTAKNGANASMLSEYETYIDKIDGSDITLTIDSTIQTMLEETLAEGIEKFDVQYGGFAIAMDPKTGSILGLAATNDSTVGYDLNNPDAIADPSVEAELEALQKSGDEEAYEEALSEAQLAQWRNKALNDDFEPGSVFKIIVLAAALEENVVSLDDTFNCTGSSTVNGTVIQCNERSGHGEQTLSEAFSNSCNSAFIEIGQRLGAEKFYDYLEHFNLIGTSGLDLPGEASNVSLVWSRDYFTSPEGYLSLATASFGQRLEVNALQMIEAATAVINGGYLMEPYVVSYGQQEDGTVIYQHDPVVIRQVVSESTSSEVRSLMEDVVNDGTGINAYVSGYRIGGKTGTSETSDYNRTLVSFLGIAPADDPQVVVYLSLDGPKPAYNGSESTADGYHIGGSSMAAPLAGPLIADILDYMEVPTQLTLDDLAGEDVTVPDTTGTDLERAETILTSADLTYRCEGKGDTVNDQLPAEGTSIPAGSEVILYLGDTDAPTDQVEVPDLLGMSLTDAQEALSDLDLFMRVNASTADTSSSSVIVFSQSVSGGTYVDPGTVIDVTFSDNDAEDFTRTNTDEN